MAPASAPSVDPENPVEEVILSRKSIRGFLPTPISRAVIAHILDVAARAPSGSNIQPWKVHVLTGVALERLRHDLTEAYLAGAPEKAEYAYYPIQWRSPYIERRRATGGGLYKLAGVKRGDHTAALHQRARNYRFFDAPVGLVFLIDRDLEQGSWLDCGMFIQNVMLAARARGLDTCPQQSIANYPYIVGRHISVPDEEMIICGMALGMADPAEPTNRLVTDRECHTDFTQFHE